MGGILSGLIGGIAKGSIGGVLQEGARKQKQVEDDRSLLTRMHMQRIEDWENLSPEEQDFHVRSVEELHPELKKSGVLRTGINIAQAVTPHFTNMATLEQAPDPLAGVAQQAGLPTVATKRTPAQNKLLQAKLYEQNIAESERKRKVAAIQAIPEVPGGKERLIAEVETGRPIPQVPTGNWSQPVGYIDSMGKPHRVIQNNRTRALIDTTTGEELPTLPSDWLPEPKPRDLAPGMSIGPANELQYTDVNRIAQEFKRGGPTAPFTIQPGAKVRAGVPTYQPLVGQTGQVEGVFSNRTGAISPLSQEQATAAEGLRKSPMSTPELEARGSIGTLDNFANIITTLSQKHIKELGGPFGAKGKWESLKSAAGYASPEMDELIRTAKNASITITYLYSGKQINETEAARLAAVMPDPTLPLIGFQNNLKRFKQTLEIMKKVRRMGKAYADESDFAELDKRRISAPPKTQSKTGNKILSITLSPNQ